MKTFTKIGDWLPVDAWLARAAKDAFEKAGRHDVPKEVPATDRDGKPVYIPVVDGNGKPVLNADGSVKTTRKMVKVAPDLRDEKSRWWGAPGGGRLAGQVLLTDLAEGSYSPVVPMLLGFLSMLMITIGTLVAVSVAMRYGGNETLSSIVGVGGVSVALLAAVATLVILWHGIGLKGLIMQLIWGSMFAILTVGAWLLISTVFGMKGVMLSLAAPLLLIACVAVIMLLPPTQPVGDGPVPRNLLKICIAVAAAVLGIICLFVIPGALHAFIPYVWCRKQRKKRAWNLAWMANMFGGDERRLSNTDAIERKKQAVNVEADKSGFIAYGIAMGILTKKGDGYSPDKGLVVGQSPKDLMTHKHIFGKTNSGKSFNEMMKTAFGWIRAGFGGALILDGKGPLPAEILEKYLHLPNVLLLVPGVKLGLIEGLAPEEVMTAISDLAGAGATKQEQSADNEQFFNSSGKTLLLNTSLIAKALVELSKLKAASGHGRTWFWTIEQIDVVKTLIKDKNDEAEAILKLIEDSIGMLPEDLGEGDGKDRLPMLRSAMLYFPHKFWTMPSDTRGSVVSVVETWLDPLMRSPDLRPWACTETGVDPTICLRGGIVGMSLPDFVYGEAGKLCQNLLRHRIMSGVRRRQDKSWDERGEKPILFLVDEAQEMVGVEDRRFLSVARSHGGACVYATQSYEAYTSRMGKEAANAFLDNFVSKAVLTSSHGTYEMMANEFPEGKFIQWVGNGNQVIGYEQTLQFLAGHVLFADNHPLKHEMRLLRRAGAGKISIPERLKTLNLNGVPFERKRDMDTIGKASDLTPTARVSGEMKVVPLVTMADCGAHLKKQTAIVKLMRGGVPRWDFIEYPHMSEEDIREQEVRVGQAIVANYLTGIIEEMIKEEWQNMGGEKLSKGGLHALTLGYIAAMVEDPSVETLQGADLFEAIAEADATIANRMDENRDYRNEELHRIWHERGMAKQSLAA